jgi:hypothetical protein
MDDGFRRLTDFLVGLGVGEVGHSGKTYLAHLANVHRLMEEQGCDADLCRAGLFHSIYGTEQFQGFKLPLERRPELRTLIGDRAERLAYLNCAIDRASLDRELERGTGPYCIRDRLTNEPVQLSPSEFDDLCRVHLYDWLEQAPRSRLGWGYRRRPYRLMAERLGSTAQQAYQRVFQHEPAPAGPLSGD